MSKKGKLKSYARVKGLGDNCPKCSKPMERRERIKPPKTKTYFYKEWDYCLPCNHVQHYDRFKSAQWQEDEQRDNLFKSLMP